jgi:acetyl-CoA carboxylase carboxyltransferase component
MLYREIIAVCSACRIYMDAKKLLNQKNYIMKDKKITEMEIEEMKRELQARQRSYLEEREEEKLEYPCTIKDGEQKLSAVFTTEEEMEIDQHRNQIYKLREKIESTYYQVDTNNNGQQTKITEIPK